MKIPKTLWIAALAVAFTLTSANVAAQTLNKVSVVKIKDCYMKKDGKMVQYTNGVPMKLKKAVILENGTKIKRNGVCIMPDKTKIRMEEGNCIDKAGKIGDCAVKENPTTSL
jgi:tRNA A58 N-methylase Trm61